MASPRSRGQAHGIEHPLRGRFRLAAQRFSLFRQVSTQGQDTIYHLITGYRRGILRRLKALSFIPALLDNVSCHPDANLVSYESQSTPRARLPWSLCLLLLFVVGHNTSQIGKGSKAFQSTAIEHDQLGDGPPWPISAL